MPNQNSQFKILCLINFLRDMNLVTAALAPLMLSGNLPLHTFFLTLAVFRISFSVLSIPSGMYADWVGPRKALITSGAFALLSAVSLLVLRKTLPGFIIMNFFNCISACLLIASSSKALIDIYPEHADFIKKYPHKLSLKKLSMFLSGAIAAGVIFIVGIDAIMWLQLLCYAALLFAAFKFNPATHIQQPVVTWSDYGTAFKNIPYFEMCKVIIVAMPFFVCMDLFLQPMLTKANFPDWVTTAMVSASNLLVFWSMKNSVQWGKIFSKHPVISVVASLSPVIIYAITGSPLLSLIGIVITIISRSSSVIEMGLFIQKVPSSSRGTYESVLNTFQSLMVGGLSFGFAFIDKSWGMRSASYALIGILLILMIGFHFWNNKFRKIVTISNKN